MGVACLNASPADTDGARFHLERAKEMLDCLKTNAQACGEVWCAYHILLLR